MDTISTKTETAKQHIHDIRENKFSIGRHVSNPLTEDLHNAVINLSAELYTKDVHFLMELIQNAEDNHYSEGVDPGLEFVLTYSDITGLSAPATLLVFNNEVGFSKDNIESLCSIGRSIKKGQRHKGFIGEKGIGFKSVFIVSEQPHILSNGYRIKFNEAPHQECGVGYIVPEWLSSKPYTSDVQKIYGSEKILPATTIILPLKHEKLAVVRKHLAEIHPELLLFLQKIKRLSVREITCSSVPDSISAISIASERNIVSLDLRMVQLSVQEELDTPEATARYLIYRKVYPVDTEHRVGNRKNVDEWLISLAFPFSDRLNRGSSSVGIFAFLPTAMVTNFPFIVQVDFILASSREAILLDNKWNLGILDNVPSCFLSAFMTCIRFSQMTRISHIPRVLEFLPLNESSVKQLNTTRESIKLKVRSECVIPSESILRKEMVLRKSTKVVRNLPEFKKILSRVKDLIVPANGKASHELFFLHNCVDDKKYDRLWTFLGVPSVEQSFEKCLEFIQTNNIVFRVHKQVYADILFFISKHWIFGSSPPIFLQNMHLFKYVSGTQKSEVELSCTVEQVKRKKYGITVFYAKQLQHHSWLKKCNLVMGSPDNGFFLTDFVVTAINGHKDKDIIWDWLNRKVGIWQISASSYCYRLCQFAENEKDLTFAASLAHFIYHSTLKFPSDMKDVSSTLKHMPVIDKTGNVRNVRSCETLVPASKSKWVKLFGSRNSDTGDDIEDMEMEDEWLSKYVELGEVYAKEFNFAGQYTPENELLNFLIHHGKAIDLPDMFPPNGPIHIASCELKSDKGLLLLEWIHNLRAKEGQPHPDTWSPKYKIPERFMESIKCGKWIMTYSGFISPTSCYLYDGNESSDLLNLGKAFEVISIIDEEYYEGKIRQFRDELTFIGVQYETGNIFELIVDRVKTHISSSAMSAQLGISVLSFFRYAKKNNKLDLELLNALKESKWLKTNEGYVSPLEAVYLESGIGEALLKITDLYVVDNAYYGRQLNKFVHELKLLGVKANMGDIYDLIPDHFSFPVDISWLTKEAVMLLLKCIRLLGPAADSLKEKIRTQPWINTTLGFKCPSESLLLDPSWSLIINIVPLPLINATYYGSKIRAYKAELRAIGVGVDLDQACNMLIEKVKVIVSSSDLTAETAILVLDFMKRLKTKMPLQLSHLVSYFSMEKWLKTSHGFKSASECVLSDFKWKTVSMFVDLPFIDEIFYESKIFSFREELKMLGVVVDFYEGAHIIARRLEFPDDKLSIPSESIKSLIHCSQSLRHSTKLSDQSLLEELIKKLRGCKWLKTHMGYRIPEESLIFKSEWKSCLEEQDGPFIDRGFYGILSLLEVNELKAIGVKTNIFEVCNSLFQLLPYHEKTPAILRSYRFLHKNKWCLNFENNYSHPLWIPDQLEGGGKWVKKSTCVLHDRDNRFGSVLHILDKHYDEELLSFVSMNFGVDSFPTVYHYVDLWDSWVKKDYPLSFLDLHFYWQYVSENWNTFIEKNLDKRITVLPATTILGMVELIVRNELFIPDDLELKKAFSEVSETPLFVWFPQNGSSSLTKLYQIYTSLGVQKISQCVQVSVKCNFEKMILKESLIGKPLVKVIIAFLADPVVNMLVEERQRVSRYLLDLPVYGTDSLMLATCSLHLPISNKSMNVQVSKLVLWDKNLKRLLIHKPSLKYEEIQKDVEFVSQFAKAISEAVLPNATEPANDLCKIIKMVLHLGLKEDGVNSFLVSENLELSPIDGAFLDCLFLAVSSSPLTSGKRKSLRSDTSQTPEKVLRR